MQGLCSRERVESQLGKLKPVSKYKGKRVIVLWQSTCLHAHGREFHPQHQSEQKEKHPAHLEMGETIMVLYCYLISRIY